MAKIKVAIALSNEYFTRGSRMRSRGMWDYPVGRFLANEFAGNVNNRIDATFHFHSTHDKVDVQEFSGYDAVVNGYILSPRRALQIDRFDKFKGVKCCVAVEPHNVGRKLMGTRWFEAYYRDNYSFCWYHYPVECMTRSFRQWKLVNTSIDYRRIVPGINRTIYNERNGAKSSDFKSRIKNKILLTGQLGCRKRWQTEEGLCRFYILRQLCAKHPDVEFFKRIRFFGSRYPALLQRYRASIAACTEYTVMKYIESAACGNLVFMEGTDLNAWESLGFIDGFSAVRIDRDNYKLKFQEFLETSDDPKWNIIANEGRKFAFDTFDTNIQANLLVDYIEEYL